jgi:ABC-type polysaccharide/polyol phosphate export permease
MFQVETKRSLWRTALSMMDLIYHSIVRDLRKDHKNALMGLVMNMFQTVIFVMTFFMMFAMLGVRGAAIRGDFLLYIMSGIFMFVTHTKAMGAVVGSEGPASPMMQHAPMNTFVAIAAAALSSLYIQTLSLVVILFVYHVAFNPVVIHDPIGALGMLLTAWFTGVGVGSVFLAVKPWSPDFTRIASSIYSRVNMIASGKMFVANTLSSSMLVMFEWNPLFHIVDQTRGYVFLHYNPHFTSSSYPVYFGIGLIMVGMMAEFYTRKNASVSWNAGR